MKRNKTFLKIFSGATVEQIREHFKELQIDFPTDGWLESRNHVKCDDAFM